MEAMTKREKELHQARAVRPQRNSDRDKDMPK